MVIAEGAKSVLFGDLAGYLGSGKQASPLQRRQELSQVKSWVQEGAYFSFCAFDFHASDHWLVLVKYEICASARLISTAKYKFTH